jgi:hypothetical protein
MRRALRQIDGSGDSVLAEWDTETVTPERLAEIEAEFKEKIREGYFAADITDRKNVLIDRFDPSADLLLIPKLQGG